jgi:hypothetical protein
VGISSGASAPDHLVQDLVDLFRARGVRDVSEVHVVNEDVRFMLPKPIREAVPAAGPAGDAVGAPCAGERPPARSAPDQREPSSSCR